MGTLSGQATLPFSIIRKWGWGMQGLRKVVGEGGGEGRGPQGVSLKG